MTLQPHQQRVIDEKKDLDEKLAKLDKFTRADNFESIVGNIDECNRLRDQADHMFAYSKILGERIAAFK